LYGDDKTLPSPPTGRPYRVAKQPILKVALASFNRREKLLREPCSAFNPATLTTYGVAPIRRRSLSMELLERLGDPAP
jgi:hypothetical protein